jgi:hypothetical protein
MRRIVMTGAFTLALTLGACAAKQPPTPPPLNLHFWTLSGTQKIVI